MIINILGVPLFIPNDRIRTKGRLAGQLFPSVYTI